MSAPSIQSQTLQDSSVQIHSTAVVSPSARIGANCRIGPFAVIGDEVVLGQGVHIHGHCVIDGRTRVGDETEIFPFVSIGLPPQDLKFAGEISQTEIGRRNRIREFVTIHRGTSGGGGITKTGDDCFIMAQAHIAHDCLIGNRVIMANAATLAGHVMVADGANIGAYSGVHQFCRVGREAYVGGYSVVVKDALPFALTVGNHAKCYGLNKVGVRRRGYSRDTIAALHHAFHLLLSAKLNTTQALDRIREEIKDSAEVDELVRFVEDSKRGVVK
jgi:UDP-N-acetylglucosamine acyltransferase